MSKAIQPVEVFLFCQRAQRAGLSQRQALLLFRDSGMRIGTARFRDIWHAGKAAEVMIWNRAA